MQATDSVRLRRGLAAEFAQLPIQGLELGKVVSVQRDAEQGHAKEGHPAKARQESSRNKPLMLAGHGQCPQKGCSHSMVSTTTLWIGGAQEKFVVGISDRPVPFRRQPPEGRCR